MSSGARCASATTARAAIDLVRAAESCLLLVLALAIIGQDTGEHGLSLAADSVLPRGAGPSALLAVAALSALLANP